jgi:hypothetical protein
MSSATTESGIRTFQSPVMGLEHPTFTFLPLCCSVLLAWPEIMNRLLEALTRDLRPLLTSVPPRSTLVLSIAPLSPIRTRT